MKANTEGRIHRGPGSNTLRDAGRPGRRCCRQGARRGGDDEQHLGHADPFPAAGAWRRHLHPRRHQISGRPFGRASRTVSANAATWGQLHGTHLTMGCCAPPTMSTRCCAGCAPWACGSNAMRRTRSNGALARRRGRGRPRASPCPAELSRPRHLETRFFPAPAGIFSIVLKGGGKPAAHAFLDALQISGSAIPGA